MNAAVISKQHVPNCVLDKLAQNLPVIIAEVLEVPGGNLAMVSPEQVSLAFSQASSRDIGTDIRIMVFARRNAPRASSENDRAKAIQEKVNELVTACGESHSIDIRLYLMEIGASEHSPNM